MRHTRALSPVCLATAALVLGCAGALASAGTGPSAPAPAPTSASAAAPNCTAAATQAALNACAFDAFTAAGAAQAAALQALQQGLAAADRARLLKAQQAHTAYAAAQCDFESGAVAGGSAQPMVKWQCMARLTQARAEALRAATRCEEGDLSCVRPLR